MGKIESNKKKKRQDILRAAYELFTTTGFQKTSILSIALKAGVGKGTFYLYFDSKEDVRDELIMLKSSQLFSDAMRHLASFETAQEKALTITDRFLFTVDYILEQLAADHTLLHFVSKNLTWGLFLHAEKYSSVDDEILDFPTFMEEYLQQEKQKLRNPELLFYTLLELTSATCYNIILYHEPVSLEEYKPYLYDCIRNLIEASLTDA